uniref:Uncharacterized protein n=1 Tax=Photinus pyralis TaxID=7054 RepID=A0A1Y1MSI8_PHOPY
MIIPKLKMSAAVAGAAGSFCCLSLLPPTPAAIMILMRAGIKANVSKICNTLKPAKETIKDNTEITTMPTFGVMVPDDIAERHCPPTTQMMALNPVNVARFNRTGMETR